jgi:hypothetical protein
LLAAADETAAAPVAATARSRSVRLIGSGDVDLPPSAEAVASDGSWSNVAVGCRPGGRAERSPAALAWTYTKTATDHAGNIGSLVVRFT